MLERLLEHVGATHRLDQVNRLEEPDFPVEVVWEVLGGDSHEATHEPFESGVEGVDVRQGEAPTLVFLPSLQLHQVEAVSLSIFAVCLALVGDERGTVL